LYVLLLSFKDNWISSASTLRYGVECVDSNVSYVMSCLNILSTTHWINQMMSRLVLTPNIKVGEKKAPGISC